jgi:hypothetical protein
MNTIYVLAGLLLLALIFIEISFALPEKRKEQVKKLLKLDEAHLLEELGRATILLKLCLISGLLLSGLYAVSAFAGSELQHISQWGLTHWVGAIIGLVVIVTITMSQSFAHSSQMHNAGRFVVIMLLITFAIFSEISNPSEREEMKMAQKSQDSAVFQAVLGEIKGGSRHQPDYSQSIAMAQANLARHEFELGRCERHANKGEKRVKRCEDHENNAIAQVTAQIASYQQANMNAANQSSANKQALIQQAKSLERNTDNHSAIIKFLKTALDTDYQHAMILAALILVVAFEAGFGFAGYNVAMYKEALVQKGNKDILYAIEAKRIKAAYAFREKTGRYGRAMLTTQDTGSPDAAIKKSDSDAEIKTDSNTAIHTREVPKTVAEKEDKKDSNGARNLHPRAHKYFKDKEQPVTAFTHNENTGTQEQNYDLFGAEKHKSDEQLKAEIHAMKNEIHAIKNRNNTENQQDKNKGVEQSENLPMSNRTRTVKNTEKNTPKIAINSLQITPESALYQHVKEQLQNQTIVPTARQVKTACYNYLKGQNLQDDRSLTMPKCTRLANTVIAQLLTEKIIIDNPHFKRGLPKYIKA